MMTYSKTAWEARHEPHFGPEDRAVVFVVPSVMVVVVRRVVQQEAVHILISSSSAMDITP
jgi:hypothetical protein